MTGLVISFVTPLLALVALAACYMPARPDMSLDPAQALALRVSFSSLASSMVYGRVHTACDIRTQTLEVLRIPCI